MFQFGTGFSKWLNIKENKSGMSLAMIIAPEGFCLRSDRDSKEYSTASFA